MDIDIARAQVIQARLYDNPTIYYEQNAYNPLRKNIPLDISSGSQFQASFQQLIYLAGKRNKRIKLAELSADKTEKMFEELLRNLRYELRSTFFKIYFEQQKYQMYIDKIITVRDLVFRYEKQAAKGNIPISEVTRLKALMFQLESERLELIDDLVENQHYLALFLQIPVNQYINPSVENDALNKIPTASLNFENLVATALENRTDLKIQKLQSRILEQDYQYQKALAVPDINLALTYDRFGSFAANYVGVGFGINLPFFNRNQGNIQASKIAIEQNNKLLQQKELTIEQEVSMGLQKLNLADSLMRTFNKGFINDFDKLLLGITGSYEKRNIGLIEFLDFYQTYIESKTQMFDIQLNRMQCIEHLNLVIAKQLFEY